MAVGLVGFLVSTYVITTYLEPFFNKFFAMIWTENNKIKSSAVDRLQELYVDSDKNEEALLLQASIEENVSREQILRTFNAVDARDLAAILRGKPRDFFTKLNKLTEKKSKKNMYGR
jgi:hypothetical protein